MATSESPRAIPSAPEIFYDQWYSQCEGDRSQSGMVIDRDRIVLDMAGEGDSLLDLGCGGGFLTRLCPYRYRAGVEVSPKAVELARAQGIDAKLCNTDQEPIPFPDQTFDTVLVVEVLEHLYDPIRALAEVNRVLKPGGRVIASSPNVGFIAIRLALLGGKFTDYHGMGMLIEDHIRFYTFGSFKRMFELTGFKVTNQRGCTKEPEFLSARHYERVGLPAPKRGEASQAPPKRPWSKYLPNYWRLIKLGKLALHDKMPKLFSAGIIVEALRTGDPEYTENAPVDFRGRDLTKDSRAIQNY